MGRITPYEQQVGIVAPEQQSSTSLQTAGAVGDAVANVGKAAVGFSDQLHKNDVHEDTMNTYAALSDLRNVFDKRIQTETQQGTIDSEKIHQDYETAVGKVAENIKTKEGHDYLEQHSLNLGTDIIKTASTSQAQLSGQLAVEQYQNAYNVNSNTVRHNPAAFMPALKDTVNAINSMVQSGFLPYAKGEEEKRKAGEQYAQEAVYGTASINPDQAKADLDSGKYKDFIRADDLEPLYGKIRDYKSARVTDAKQAIELQKLAEKKKSEAWESSHINALFGLGDPKINGGFMTAKEIVEGPADVDTKKEMMRIMEQQQTRVFKNNPAVESSVTQKVLSGEITDSAQLYKYVGPNMMDGAGYNRAATFLANTPEGKELKDSRELLMKQAKNAILKTSPFSRTTVGYDKLAMFSQDLLDKEVALRKAGKPVKDLYDAHSPDYFAKQIPKYSNSADNPYADMTTGTPQAVDVPQDQDKTRKPGESAAAYLQRMGK